MSENYYISFEPASTNQITSADGGKLYALSSTDFSVEQTLNIGSQSGGAGAGKVAFDALTFTLHSSNLTVMLDKMLTSGATFKAIDLFAVATGGDDNQSREVLQDEFKTAAVASDSIDPTTGDHTFTLQYGGLVERAITYNAQQQATTVTDGWSRITNTRDTTLINTLATVAPNGVSSTLAQIGSPEPSHLYVRLTDTKGAVLGGGWIEVSLSSYQLLQTLNIGSQSGGAGAGKATFDPLSLTFDVGTLEPTLLKALASGTAMRMELAAVRTTGDSKPMLTDDYRFGLVAGKTMDQSLSDGQETLTYTFEYGQFYQQHYVRSADGSVSLGSGDGWNQANNTVITSATDSTLPVQTAKILTPPSVTPSLDPLAGAQQDYYIAFEPASTGKITTVDNGKLYALSEADFSAVQELNIGSQSSGAGAGKVTFNGLTFTLRSSNLTTMLDKMLTSGATFKAIDLYAVAPNRETGNAFPVIQDEFQTAAVQSDSIDPTTGEHTFTLQYGALVERATSYHADYGVASAVTDGWSEITNTRDTNLINPFDTVVTNGDPSSELAQVNAPGPNHLYVRLTDSRGAAMGGWIAVSMADYALLQTLNIGSQSGGAGAGKAVFDPLSLTFDAGSLEPTLLKDLASGTAMKLELAAVKTSPGNAGPILTDDYRFGLVGGKTMGQSLIDGQEQLTYTFEYGQFYQQHYSEADHGTVSLTSADGWNRVNNTAIASATDPTLPTQLATPSAPPSVTPSTDPTANARQSYYIAFEPAKTNQITNVDKGELYELSEADFSAVQTLNIGSQSSGTGAGKVAFNPLTFTLRSSNLTTMLDGMLTSGATFKAIDLFAVTNKGETGRVVPVAQDEFQTAAVASDSIDPVTGDHTFTIQYGAVVERATSYNTQYEATTTATNGWSAVTDTADTTLINPFNTVVSNGLVSSVTAQVASPSPTQLYVRLTTTSGGLIGGANGGWIAVSAADYGLLQTLNIGSQSSGAGAGKATFNPISLTFDAGVLEPTLLQALASGTPMRMELAAIAVHGDVAKPILTDDYRFGLVAGKTADQTLGDDQEQLTYTFEYGQFYQEHYSQAPNGTVSLTSADGWNRVTNTAITSATDPTLPVQAATPSQLPGSVQTVVTDTAANLSRELDSLNADPNLTSIVVSDNRPLTLTVAQLGGDGHAIGLLSNANGSAVTFAVSDTGGDLSGARLATVQAHAGIVLVTVSDNAPVQLSLGQLQADGAVLAKLAFANGQTDGTVAIADTAAVLSAALDSLNGDGRVGAIRVTDNAPVVVDVAQLSNDSNAIGLLADADGSAVRLTVEDTAAQLRANLDALNGDAEVASIVISDNLPVRLSQPEFDSYGHAIAEMINADGSKAVVLGPLNASAPSAAVLDEGAASAVQGLSIDESGAGDGTFTATLIAERGALSATGPGIVATPSNTLQVTGTLDQVNAVLATVADTAAADDDALTLSVTDGFGASASTSVILAAKAVPTANVTGTVRVTIGDAGLTGYDIFSPNGEAVATDVVTLSPGGVIRQYFDPTAGQVYADSVRTLGGGVTERQEFDGNWNLRDATLAYDLGGGSSVVQSFDGAFHMTGAVNTQVAGPVTTVGHFDGEWNMLSGAIVTDEGGGTTQTQQFGPGWTQASATRVHDDGAGTVTTQTFDGDWHMTSGRIVSQTGGVTETQDFDGGWNQTDATIVRRPDADTTITQHFNAGWTLLDAEIHTVSATGYTDQKFDGAFNQISAETVNTYGAVTEDKTFDGAWTLTGGTATTVLSPATDLMQTYDAQWHVLAGQDRLVVHGQAAIESFADTPGIATTYVFKPGQVDGDAFASFASGSVNSDYHDVLEFDGYGPGAALSSLGAGHWQITAAGQVLETFTVAANFNPAAGDVVFH